MASASRTAGASRARSAGRGAPSARGRKSPDLSHEAIRGAALTLIDQDGIADFSTRKLGRALDCEAMAIYWYYPNKEALLDAVVDLLMSGVGQASGVDRGDWVEALRRIAHTYRRIAKEHPKAFPLLATRRFASEATYAFLEELFELARREGVSDRAAARFYRIVSSYCSGFALNEIASPPEPQEAAALRKRFKRVDAVSRWLEPTHLDGIFDFGLEILLDALGRETEREPKRR